jgi:hypothetical protein
MAASLAKSHSFAGADRNEIIQLLWINNFEYQ